MAKGSLNKVMVLGRLGRDPEVKVTAGGLNIANLTIATTESSGSKANDNYNEYAEWHRVVFFGRTAEIAAQYLTKGSKCLIEGKLQTTKWEDKNGATRYTTQIVGDQLTLLDSKKDSDPQQPLQVDKPISEADQFFGDQDIPF